MPLLTILKVLNVNFCNLRRAPRCFIRKLLHRVGILKKSYFYIEQFYKLYAVLYLKNEAISFLRSGNFKVYLSSLSNRLQNALGFIETQEYYIKIIHGYR